MAVTKIIGQQVEVAMTKEDTRGTRKAPVSGDFIERGEFTIDPQKEVGYVEASNGLMPTRQDQRSVGFYTNLTLVLNVPRIEIAKILEAVFGDATVDADNPEANVDTITYEVLNTRDVPTYSFNTIEGNNQFYYAGAVCKQAVIKVSAKALPTIELQFVAKKRASTSGMTASYPSSNSYYSSVDAVYKMEDDYSSLATALALDIIEGTITFSREINMHQYCGSDTYTDISATDWDCKVHIVKDYEDMTLGSGDVENAQDLFEGNNTKSFSLELVDTATTIGTTSNPSFKIELPAVKVNGYKMSTALKSVVGEEFDLEPIASDDTNGFALAEVVTDGAL